MGNLHVSVHTGAYRATPSRRVSIAKPEDGTRPLGVAALEDKIVQKAVAEVILTPIYEAQFLGFSYGFRPGRGAHDALDALAVGMRRPPAASRSASSAVVGSFRARRSSGTGSRVASHNSRLQVLSWEPGVRSGLRRR